MHMEEIKKLTETSRIMVIKMTGMRTRIKDLEMAMQKRVRKFLNSSLIDNVTNYIFNAMRLICFPSAGLEMMQHRKVNVPKNRSFFPAESYRSMITVFVSFFLLLLSLIFRFISTIIRRWREKYV